MSAGSLICSDALGLQGSGLYGAESRDWTCCSMPRRLSSPCTRASDIKGCDGRGHVRAGRRGRSRHVFRGSECLSGQGCRHDPPSRPLDKTDFVRSAFVQSSGSRRQHTPPHTQSPATREHHLTVRTRLVPGSSGVEPRIRMLVRRGRRRCSRAQPRHAHHESVVAFVVALMWSALAAP